MSPAAVAARALGAPAVAARGLSKRFGRSWALCALDLDVLPGACLAVLGPNGAGKSTLLRLVAGLARPSAGTLRVAGHPAGRPEARARVGCVAHATWLYPALSVRENLLFAARLHGVRDPRARADAALAAEGLGALADAPAGALSRGLAQRLAIARSLVHDPDVVLLDEPFTGLDRAAAQRLVERLVGLREEGRALLLVTHEVALAARVASAALLLDRGRVAFASGDAPRDAGELERAYLLAASREFGSAEAAASREVGSAGEAAPREVGSAGGTASREAGGSGEAAP